MGWTPWWSRGSKIRVDSVPAAPRLHMSHLGAKAGLGLENIRNQDDKTDIWVHDCQSATIS